ncbi:MAG TPA: SelB C-terminal domain-containing protein, partial [bacterium]|nr:SelB C-terminal domain-containing protein [bacterium]
PAESEEWSATLKGLARAGSVELLDGATPRAIARAEFDRTTEGALARLAAFHKAEPTLPGMPRAVLAVEALARVKAGGPDAPAVGEAVLRKLESAKKIVSVGGDVKLPGHVPAVDAANSDLRPALEKAYRDAGLTPPTVKEATDPHAARAKEVASVLALLAREGVLVKVNQDLFFHRDAMAALTERLVSHLQAKQKIGAIEFKELAGNISRKFAIPLLEHFDAVKLTMRIGDERVLRKKS